MKAPKIVAWPRQGFAELIDQRQYKIGVEVGVDHGEFSHLLLARSGLKKLYSVDVWNNKLGEWRKDHAMSLLALFPGRAQVMHATSVDAAAALVAAGVTVDFVYIDGDHRSVGVRLDINTWWPLLRSGGCLTGHDYIDGARKCGVIPIVNEFVGEDRQLYLTCEDHWKSWFVFKE
jgi:hypothetical protein